jgi:hypothetical protein
MVVEPNGQPSGSWIKGAVGAKWNPPYGQLPKR